MLSGEALRHWHTALFAAVYTCAVVALRVGLGSWPAALPGYPVRIELPPARLLAAAEAPLPFVGAAVAFDVPGADDGRGGGAAIEIAKAVRLNGADAGFATIRVGRDSTLQIATDELGRALARAGQGDAARLVGGAGRQERFVDFEEVRRQAIDVRYDAASDRILISL